VTVIAEIEKILSDEREALLVGDYEKLELLVEKKIKIERLMSDNKTHIDAVDCAKLAEKAKQNEMLLESAQKGLKAAVLQIKSMRDGDSQKTYTKDGKRSSLGRKANSIVQKI